MNLSMALIASYMKKYNPECHINETTAKIKGVRFFSESRPEKSDEYIYLGPASSYFQDERYKDALLLANESSQIICRGADYEELLNCVLSAFDFYNSFEQRLFMASSAHLPLREITKIIEEIISWPYMVFDLNGNLIGESNKDVYINEDFENMRKGNFQGFETISRTFVDSEGKISTDLSSSPQYLHPEGDEAGCVTIYLLSDDERIGYALMPVSTKLETEVGLALEPMLSKACAQCAQFTGINSVYQSDHSILLRLIKGEDIPKEVSKKLFDHTGLKGSLFLMAYKSGIIRNYTLRNMLLTELNKSGLRCLCCDYEDMSVILTDEKNLSSVTDFIKERVPSGNFYLGISLPVQRPEQINVALKQCLFAIDAKEGFGIRSCRDLALPYLILKLKETDMSSNLRHPAVGILEIYDQENNTELLKTLKVYLECSLSQSKAAKELSVHLNTLKYRLKRIFELTGINLEDYNEKFYIELSLAL